LRPTDHREKLPFTEAFLEALTHEEDELGDFFRRIRLSMDNEESTQSVKQTPVIEDSRTVKFYFNRPHTTNRSGCSKFSCSTHAGTIHSRSA